MQTWQFLYFLFNKYIKFKNRTFWGFYLSGCFETKCLETRRFETWGFVNLTFWKPDVLKRDVLKPAVLQPDNLKPDILWVYPSELVVGVPLLAWGGKGLTNKNYYSIDLGLNKRHLGTDAHPAGGLWVLLQNGGSCKDCTLKRCIIFRCITQQSMWLYVVIT